MNGGKFKIAPWIVSYFPKHRVYLEPFCGASSVLFAKPKAYVEVINDLNDDIVNVFQVLRDEVLCRRLENQLRLTPFARKEYENAFGRTDDPVENARRVIAMSYMGFGAASLNTGHRSGFRVKWSGSYMSCSNTWQRYPDSLKAFTQRLQGVTIENRDALTLIAQYNDPRCLIYCDPPYVPETRNQTHPSCKYPNDLTEEDHRKLAKVLRDSLSMVVLSGYPSDLYLKELYPDWKHVSRTARIEHGQQRTEMLWFNPAASNHTQGALAL